MQAFVQRYPQAGKAHVNAKEHHEHVPYPDEPEAPGEPQRDCPVFFHSFPQRPLLEILVTPAIFVENLKITHGEFFC